MKDKLFARLARASGYNPNTFNAALSARADHSISRALRLQTEADTQRAKAMYVAHLAQLSAADALCASSTTPVEE